MNVTRQKQTRRHKMSSDTDTQVNGVYGHTKQQHDERTIPVPRTTTAFHDENEWTHGWVSGWMDAGADAPIAGDFARGDLVQSAAVAVVQHAHAFVKQCLGLLLCHFRVPPTEEQRADEGLNLSLIHI